MNHRILLLGHGTTLGQARSDLAMVRALERYGAFDLIVVPPRIVRLPAALTRQPLVDLSEAWALRRALRRAVRLHGFSDVFVLPTTTAALLQPKRVLRRAAVRFDTLAAENRSGPRGLLSRWLERRYMKHVRVLLPYSSLELPGLPRHRYFRGRIVSAFPTPISREGPHPPTKRAEFRVVAYCANPYKKGLDWVVETWARAQLPPTAELHLVGLEPAAVDDYLRAVGMSLPNGVVVRGVLPHDEFVELVGSSSVYLAAARYEDFGIAPLEAMACGTCVVTTESSGPFEASWLLREAAPEFLAPLGDVGALARALEHALSLDPSERCLLADRLRNAAAAYSEDAVLSRSGPLLASALTRLASAAA